MYTPFRLDALGPRLVERVRTAITPDQALDLFRQIAETPAPSQTVAYSRGALICHLFRSLSRPGFPVQVAENFRGAGNTAICFTAAPRIVFLAHADEISHLVGGPALFPAPPPDAPDALPLIPFYNHNAQVDWPGRAWRYDLHTGRLHERAEGTILSRREGAGWRAWFAVDRGVVEPGDRIIYHTPTQPVEEGLLRGKVDNALAVTGLLLAALALVHVGARPAVWFLFTDEEEGPPATNANFSRGLRRLIHGVRLPAETLFVELDGHEVPHEATPGPSARFVEQAKFCHGAVTPPDLYAAFRAFAGELARRGVDVTESQGYASRSDAVAVMERYRNILLWGYDVKDTHYRHGWPTASLDALLALAQLAACTALAVGGVHGGG